MNFDSFYPKIRLKSLSFDSLGINFKVKRIEIEENRLSA